MVETTPQNQLGFAEEAPKELRINPKNAGGKKLIKKQPQTPKAKIIKPLFRATEEDGHIIGQILTRALLCKLLLSTKCFSRSFVDRSRCRLGGFFLFKRVPYAK